MRIIIIGCGRMGAGLALTMSRRGHAVAVVTKTPLALSGWDHRSKVRLLKVSDLTVRCFWLLVLRGLMV